jgi:hypothetical protein
MGKVNHEPAAAQVGLAEGSFGGLGGFGACHRHEPEAALAPVRVHRKVDANDAVGRRIVDEGLNLLLGRVVREIADVERPVGSLRWTAGAHGSARASRPSRSTHSRSAEPGRPVSSWGLGLERADRYRFARLHRSVERVPRGLRLLGGSERDEAEAAWPARHPIFGQADADDFAPRRLEELPENVFRDAVGQACHEQLRFLIRHARTHDLHFRIDQTA